MSWHTGTADKAHDHAVCTLSYCGRPDVEGDVESPLREGVRAMMYGPEDMGVSIVIPGAAAILFRGSESDLLQLSEYSRRDIAVAKALLQDAMNRLDSIQQPYPLQAPAQLAPQPYGRPAW